MSIVFSFEKHSSTGDDHYLEACVPILICLGLICVAGDIIAQQLVEQKGIKHHDIRRSIKLFGMGTLFIGPGLRTWYFVLDKIIKGSTSTAVLKKVCLDQLIWAPLFVAAYFSLSDILDGKTLSDIKRKLIYVHYFKLRR